MIHPSIKVLLLFFAGHPLWLLAQRTDTVLPEENIADGFQYVYHFRFMKADSLIAALKKKSPYNEKVLLLEANLYWWKIRSGEDNAMNRKEFLSVLSSAASALDKINRSGLVYADLFNYIIAYSYMARLELLGGNYFKAFSFFNKCSRYLFASFGKEKLYEPFYLTTGLYNYSLASAKKKYPALLPFLLMLPPAGKGEGIKFLEKSSVSSDAQLSTEGEYFLMIIYGEGDINYQQSAWYAEKLCGRYPSNLLYRYYWFKILLEDEKKDQAMQHYKLLYQSSQLNKELTQAQKKHFLSMAQKDLEKYYMKHPAGQ